MCLEENYLGYRRLKIKLSEEFASTESRGSLVFIYLFFLFFVCLFVLFFLILKSLILTCVPKHEPPSHLPPHNISLGHPHAPAPSMLYPASDIDW